MSGALFTAVQERNRLSRALQARLRVRASSCCIANYQTPSMKNSDTKIATNMANTAVLIIVGQFTEIIVKQAHL